MISAMFFLFESGSQRTLLYLTFCIYLVREILSFVRERSGNFEN